MPLAVWKTALVRCAVAFVNHDLAMIAAGVAFHVLLAILPALAAFVALYGLVADVGQIPGQLRILAVVLPHDLLGFVGQEMNRLARDRSDRLSVTFIVGLLVSIWSANGATGALLRGLGVAYETPRRRGFVSLTLVSLAFTIGWLAIFLFAGLVLSSDALAQRMLGRPAELALAVLRWPLMLIGFQTGLSLLYRYGPERGRRPWKWFTPGSLAATGLWLVGSMVMTFWVGHFTHYVTAYGSLGALIGVMIWIWLSAMVVLAGAELNAALGA